MLHANLKKIDILVAGVVCFVCLISHFHCDALLVYQSRSCRRSLFDNKGVWSGRICVRGVSVKQTDC